jgi:hypothetical protein
MSEPVRIDGVVLQCDDIETLRVMQERPSDALTAVRSRGDSGRIANES